MESLIFDSKVLICAGSGGVGKTTVAASLGVAAAGMGKKVLVLTIDPAQRLASALGLSEGFRGEMEVPGQHGPGRLYAAMMDPHRAFEQFVRENTSDKKAAERVLKNPLFHQLSTTLSGSQEFTSLDRLFCAVQSQQYDLVILDTPPAQHAVDFLRAPERIYSLFQKSITRWFIEPSEKGHFFQRFVSQGTQTVLRAFERVTGSDFIRELADFFNSVQGLQEKISQRSIEAQRLLVDPHTGFILVTGFDETKLKEAKHFESQLLRGGYRLKAVIVNRAYPLWWHHDVSASKPDQIGDEDWQKMKELREKLLHSHRSRLEAYDLFERSLSSELKLVRLPDMALDVVGWQELAALAQMLIDAPSLAGDQHVEKRL